MLFVVDISLMTSLHWIDGVIVAAYACSMMALGWYYNRKQKSTDEYFTGGGAMNPFLIGISLFATLLSTITYLSNPGEIVKNGPVILSSAFSIASSENSGSRVFATPGRPSSVPTSSSPLAPLATRSAAASR